MHYLRQIRMPSPSNGDRPLAASYAWLTRIYVRFAEHAEVSISYIAPVRHPPFMI